MDRKSSDRQLLKENRILKKTILQSLLQQPLAFYVLCIPHLSLRIGKKQLSQDHLYQADTNEGIIISLDHKNIRNLKFSDRHFNFTLLLESWQEIKIPYEAISRIFDKGGQVVMQWATIPATPYSFSMQRESKDRSKISIPLRETKRKKGKEIELAGSENLMRVKLSKKKKQIFPAVLRKGKKTTTKKSDSRVFTLDFHKR